MLGDDADRANPAGLANADLVARRRQKVGAAHGVEVDDGGCGFDLACGADLVGKFERAG